MSITNDQQESKENAKICYICEEKFQDKYGKDKYCKVRDHFHYIGECRGAARSICILRCSIPNEITIIFLNGCSHDYHVIIKDVVKEGQFISLGENTGKCITFTISIEKQVQKIGKNGEEIAKNILQSTIY